MRRNAADEEDKLKAELLQLQSSAAERTGGSEDECIRGESVVRDEREPVCQKLMESLSVGLSRVAQLTRDAAASQMNVEMSAGTPKGTARGVCDADWTPAQQPDRRRPGSLGRHRSRIRAGFLLKLQFRGFRTRTWGAHDVCQIGSEPSQSRM